jgi:hypothetical protein
VEGSLEICCYRLVAFGFDVIELLSWVLNILMKIFIVFVDWLLAKAAVLNILINEWEMNTKRIKNGI